MESGLYGKKLQSPISQFLVFERTEDVRMSYGISQYLDMLGNLLNNERWVWAGLSRETNSL